MFRHLTIKQLETFYWVARLGSFSAAASRLNTTQPSVSVRIRDMEKLLRLSLFDRGGRLPRLTPKGREFAGQVERIMALGEEFDHLLDGRDSISGLVRVGAADTVALTWLPELMAELGRRYPGISVELIVDLSVNLRMRLHNGDLDIGFLVGALNRPEFEARSLGFVEQRWMCSPRLGLPQAGVTGQQLVSWPVFTHSRGSDHFHTVQHWFEAEGARPERLHGCSSLATMIVMTVAGLGVAVLPHAMLPAELRDGRLTVVRTARAVPAYEFVEVHLARPAGRAVQAVAELAREVALACPIFLRTANAGSAARTPAARSRSPRA